MENLTDISIERAPNGGWIIYGKPEHTGLIPHVVAAFSSLPDLLDNLGAILKA